MTTADEAATIAKAIKANASNLGLTWNLRLATVRTAGVLPTVLMDGDDTSAPSIPAISLMGAVVVGARVMTLWVPPTTLFLVGSPGGTAARTMTNRVWQQASVDRTLTAADQVIVGTSVTVATAGAAAWEATGVFDANQTTVNLAQWQCSLYVDNVQQTTVIVHIPTVAAIFRTPLTTQWSGSFTASGPHTLELRARVVTVAGTSIIRATHTTINVKTFE